MLVGGGVEKKNGLIYQNKHQAGSIAGSVWGGWYLPALWLFQVRSGLGDRSRNKSLTLDMIERSGDSLTQKGDLGEVSKGLSP